MKTPQTPLQRLRHHVTGAIERDEAIAIAGQPSTPGKLTKLGKQWEAEQQKASVNADEQFKAAATPAQASGNCRTSHSPLPKLKLAESDAEAVALGKMHRYKAHAQRLADACKLWHKASLQPEGSKAQADFGNAAALASREALAQYNEGK